VNGRRDSFMRLLAVTPRKMTAFPSKLRARTEKIVENAIGHELEVQTAPPWAGFSAAAIRLLSFVTLLWGRSRKAWEPRLHAQGRPRLLI
jgi:hypothetical protein